MIKIEDIQPYTPSQVDAKKLHDLFEQELEKYKELLKYARMQVNKYPSQTVIGLMHVVTELREPPLSDKLSKLAAMVANEFDGNRIYELVEEARQLEARL